MNDGRQLVRAVCIALTLAPALARAANCGSEPSGFGSGAAFQSWRSWCSCMGGTPPATFNEAQRVGCRGAGSASGTAGSSGSIGTVIGTAVGQALGDALFGNPEEDALRAAQAARAADAAAAQHQAREAEAARRAAALLDQMLDVEATPPGTEGFAGNSLGLMLGDAPIPRAATNPGNGPSIMPGRAPARPLRNQPPAVIKRPAVAAPGQDLAEQLMQDPVPTAAAPAPVVVAPAQAIDSYAKGFEHGSGCYSQNSGPTCSGAAPQLFDTCIADYRAGYQVGERAMKTEIDNAYRAGQRARAAGELNNGAAQSGAVGTCRIEWIKAYSNGHAGAPHP